MGHQHLQVIPRSRAWRQIVAMIAGGAALADIAAATSRAAETSMIDAGEDETVRHAFYLLARIPQAACEDDFGRALSRLGVNAGPAPTMEAIAQAMMEAIDRFSGARRTDFGEIAQLCAVESLYGVASNNNTKDLFGDGPDQIRDALAGLADPRQFAVLARDFFARLTRRHLNFYLQRELANHVGRDRRFPGLQDLARFEAAMDQHCREVSRIIKEFAGQWFVKHSRQGGIDPDQAGRFVHVAAAKIREELVLRGPAHA